MRGGMVVRAGEIYGRIGPKLETLEEQIHTVSLHKRGFPVAEVLESGPLDDNKWFFTESSLGNAPFHAMFKSEYAANTRVSDDTFARYLNVIERYAAAQADDKNHVTVSAAEFVTSVVPEQLVFYDYSYFGHDEDRYREATRRATERLSAAPMGVLQYDLNPYNILERGVIDFEEVGYGPIGYDTVLSARWAGGWFPNYPAHHTMAYRLDSTQISLSDERVDSIARQHGVTEPSRFLEEFLLIRTAWACSAFLPISSDTSQESVDFRRYRAKLLEVAVDAYLDNRPIPYSEFSSIRV